MTLTHCKLAGDQYGIYDEDQQTAGAYKAVLGNRDGDGEKLAVLFAAAPELLAALVDILNAIQTETSALHCKGDYAIAQEFRVALKAIAKAKGGQ